MRKHFEQISSEETVAKLFGAGFAVYALLILAQVLQS